MEKTVLNLFDNKLANKLRYSTREFGFLHYISTKEDVKVDTDVFLQEFNINLQRELCWQKESLKFSDDKYFLDKQFILSILTGKDTGKFVFIVNWSRDGIYECIDGKQRLNAFLSFVNIEFPILAPDNNFYFFKDFNAIDKRFFMSKPCNVCLIDDGGRTAELSDKEKIELFFFINNTGVKIEQEYLDNLQNLIV